MQKTEKIPRRFIKCRQCRAQETDTAVNGPEFPMPSASIRVRMDISTNREAARHPGPHRPGKVLTLTRARFVRGHLPTRFTERAAVRDRTQAVGGAGAGETLEAGSRGDQLRSRGQARSLALGGGGAGTHRPRPLTAPHAGGPGECSAELNAISYIHPEGSLCPFAVVTRGPLWGPGGRSREAAE